MAITSVPVSTAAGTFVQSCLNQIYSGASRLTAGIAKGLPANAAVNTPALQPSDILAAVAQYSTADQATINVVLAALAPPSSAPASPSSSPAEPAANA